VYKQQEPCCQHCVVHPVLSTIARYNKSLNLTVENKSIFQLKSEMHGINTRQNFNIYQPQANLTLYQKGVYYSGVKIFNNLPPPV